MLQSLARSTFFFLGVVTFMLGATLALGQRPAAAETISVTYWGGTFYGAPYAVAMKKGYFKQRGVDITGILSSQGGGTTVRNTLAAGLPYGEVALSAALDAINKGQQLKIVNSGVGTVGDVLWVTQKGSKIKSVKDLVGKKVGFNSVGSTTHMLLLMSLKEVGIDPSPVTMMPAGAYGLNTSTVISGGLDAGVSGEPVWSQTRDKVQPAFWVKDVLNPAMMQTVGITTTEFAESRPEVLRAIISARAEGVRFIMEHPDEAADITAEAYKGDAQQFRELFRNFVAINYWSEGAFDYKAMDRMAEGLKIVGKLDGTVDWSKMANTRFVTAATNKAR